MGSRWPRPGESSQCERQCTPAGPPEVLVTGEGQPENCREADELLPDLEGTMGWEVKIKADITQQILKRDFSVNV